MLNPNSVNSNWEDTLWGPFSLINNVSLIILTQFIFLKNHASLFLPLELDKVALSSYWNITYIYRLHKYDRYFYLTLTTNLCWMDCDHKILQIIITIIIIIITQTETLHHSPKSHRRKLLRVVQSHLTASGPMLLIIALDS